CFLHSLNTLIGDIMSFPEMKKIVTQTTHVVTFFNSSHYWGGQLNDEAKKHNINRKMKQNCESRFYALILQCLSVLEYRSPLTLICMHPDAKKKTNGLAPITSEVINTILNDLPYWRLLEQIVTTVKFIVDAVGNLKSRQASLADCMLELLRCAKQMSQLACEQDYHVGFWLHARSVFNCRFHTMNTEVHSLALFLHPMCRKLAVTQVANGRSLAFMVKIALGIAKRWKWDIMMAKKLSDDLQAYNQSVAPFAGGHADGLSWWQNLPINSEIHPLKAFAVTILSIVGHAGEVERTFSDLGITQSARRCNLSVETFETLGKICANLRHHSTIKAAEAGKSTRCRHAHMHTREEVGIAVETAQDLEASFAWAPPLSAEPRDADDLLAGPESISPDNVAAEFAALEELKRTEEVHDIDEVEVLEGNVFDFDELDRVEQGIIPQAILDEVEVVNYNGEDDGWDEETLMSSLGMS
ncbi:ribonuclease H-like domain-containing protein, partial [Suillus plorans]